MWYEVCNQSFAALSIKKNKNESIPIPNLNLAHFIIVGCLGFL